MSDELCKTIEDLYNLKRDMIKLIERCYREESFIIMQCLSKHITFEKILQDQIIISKSLEKAIIKVTFPFSYQCEEYSYLWNEIYQLYKNNYEFILRLKIEREHLKKKFLPTDENVLYIN